MRIPASPRASDMLRMIRKPWIRVRGMREWAPQARLRWTTPRYAPHLRGKFRPRCALGLLLQRLANTEARIIRMVHDEIILEVPDRLAGEVAVILKETMVQPYSKTLLTEDPMTLQEIGGKFGIIRERVRQIESNLKKKLKIYLEEEIADIDLLQESMIEI